jgi:hypothetical protein
MGKRDTVLVKNDGRFKFDVASHETITPNPLVQSMSRKSAKRFSDKDMLQLFDFERVLFDRVIPRDQDAL